MLFCRFGERWRRFGAGSARAGSGYRVGMLSADDFDHVAFGPPSRRQQGYDANEVDRFLVVLRAAIAARDPGSGSASSTATPTAADLRRVRFSTTAWGTGYNQLEVDDVLAHAARILTLPAHE